MARKTELIFIYNADSGISNALVDYGKKLVSPDKYDCQLCMVTYGPFGMKKEWKKFIASLNKPVRFLHKDEFEKEFPETKLSYPCLVKNTGGKIDIAINNVEFNKIKNLDDLKAKVAKII